LFFDPGGLPGPRRPAGRPRPAEALAARVLGRPGPRFAAVPDARGLPGPRFACVSSFFGLPGPRLTSVNFEDLIGMTFSPNVDYISMTLKQISSIRRLTRQFYKDFPEYCGENYLRQILNRSRIALAESFIPPLQGLDFDVCCDPGLRFAPPWAIIFRPFRPEKTAAEKGNREHRDIVS
jgi:hypothetical protein